MALKATGSEMEAGRLLLRPHSSRPGAPSGDHASSLTAVSPLPSEGHVCGSSGAGPVSLAPTLPSGPAPASRCS